VGKLEVPEEALNAPSWLEMLMAMMVDDLIDALGDKDPKVRAEAAEALGKIGDPRAIDPLILLLNTSDEWVQLDVARSLVMLGRTEYYSEPFITIRFAHDGYYDKLGYSTPATGKIYHVFKVDIENHGYDEFEISRYRCKININQVEYEPSGMYALEDAGLPPLESVTLLDGGKISEYVAFEVPRSTDYSIRYDLYSWEDYDIIYIET